MLQHNCLSAVSVICNDTSDTEEHVDSVITGQETGRQQKFIPEKREGLEARAAAMLDHLPVSKEEVVVAGFRDPRRGVRGRVVLNPENLVQRLDPTCVSTLKQLAVDEQQMGEVDETDAVCWAAVVDNEEVLKKEGGGFETYLDRDLTMPGVAGFRPACTELRETVCRIVESLRLFLSEFPGGGVFFKSSRRRSIVVERTVVSDTSGTPEWSWKLQ